NGTLDPGQVGESARLIKRFRSENRDAVDPQREAARHVGELAPGLRRLAEDGAGLAPIRLDLIRNEASQLFRIPRHLPSLLNNISHRHSQGQAVRSTLCSAAQSTPRGHVLAL